MKVIQRIITNHKINTIEKCWSFNERIYEFPEDKKPELLKHGINISPNDYAWVIDIFEKTAINDSKVGKEVLADFFEKRAPPEVAKRVTRE